MISVTQVVSELVLSPLPVDDGGGVIECTQWRKVEDSEQGLYIPALGELVSVHGRVTEYRGERQIKVSHIGILTHDMKR